MQILTIVLSMLGIQLSYQSTQFYGDVDLQNYLSDWCQSANTNSQLILILNFQVGHKSQLSQRDGVDGFSIREHLSSIKCPSSLYQSIEHADVEQLITMLTISIEFKSKELLMLFDLRGQKQWNQTLFSSYLDQLNRVYSNCPRCSPFIVYFNIWPESVYSWTVSNYDNLTVDYRSVLVSTKTNRDGISACVHVNPIINGCLQYAGVFVPQNQFQFDQLKVPYQHCNLNGTTLDVAVNHEIPYCIFRDNGTMDYSLEFELLRTLMKRFNFNVNLINANQSYGSFVDGHWTGVVGHVFNKTAHLGMCSLSRTFERLQVVDFKVVNINQLTFMSIAPDEKLRHWIVAEPFSESTWLGILVSFMAVFSVIYIVTIRTNNSSASSTIHQTMLANSVLTKLLQILLTQTIHLGTNLTNLKLKLLYASLFLASLILSNSYTGHFYSILTLPEYDSPVDDVSQLCEAAISDSANIITFANSSFLSAFMTAKAESGLYYAIGQHINRTNSKMVKFDSDVRKLFEKSAPRNILIATRLYLTFFRQIYSQSNTSLYIGSENINSDHVGIAFAKNSPLFKPFGSIINTMGTNGLFEKTIRDSYYRTPSQNRHIYLNGNPVINSNKIAPLKLKDLYSVFLIWFLGIGWSFGIFLSEIIVFIYFATRKRSDQ